MAVLIAVLCATPYLWLGVGVHRLGKAIARPPAEVAWAWAGYLDLSGLGYDGDLDAATDQECPEGSHPSARELHELLEHATATLHADGGWLLSIHPGIAKVHPTGWRTGTADVPANVTVTYTGVTFTQEGMVTSRTGTVVDRHQWTIHLTRTRELLGAWLICGITTDRPLFTN